MIGEKKKHKVISKSYKIFVSSRHKFSELRLHTSSVPSCMHMSFQRSMISCACSTTELQVNFMSLLSIQDNTKETPFSLTTFKPNDAAQILFMKQNFVHSCTNVVRENLVSLHCPACKGIIQNILIYQNSSLTKKMWKKLPVFQRTFQHKAFFFFLLKFCSS